MTLCLYSPSFLMPSLTRPSTNIANQLVDNITSILWMDDPQLHDELLKRHLFRRTPPTPSTTVGGDFIAGVTGIEWDQSCDDDQKKVIIDAWHGASNMLQDTINMADKLCVDYCESDTLTKEKNAELNAKWPALRKTLSTKSTNQENILKQVAASLQDMKKNVNNIDGPKRKEMPEAERTLRLTCRRAMNGDQGAELCEGDTRAFVLPPGIGYSAGTTNGEGSQGDYRSVDSWLLNFCAPFFDNDRFPSNTALETKLINDGDKKLCNIAKLHSTATIMFHEWTHLPWTINLEAKKYDKIAVENKFDDIAALANIGWRDARQNADSWAWMAAWTRWAGFPQCDGCDLWPNFPKNPPA
ncbi:MAG: hypothetical protein M1817_004656 [Caeruleum heppii]|nr:MAG: hypothetical protein M1817_004656 [Caeruleum heppii]